MYKKKRTMEQPRKGSPMDAALSYLGYRARTVREMERHLDEKNFGEYEVYAAVEKLKEYGYLDDAKFAADFVASRLKEKPISRRKLVQELSLHELDRDLIEEAVSVITDEVEAENAYRVACKYYDSYADSDPFERKQILMRRVVSRGFDYGVAQQVIERIEAEHSDD